MVKLYFTVSLYAACSYIVIIIIIINNELHATNPKASPIPNLFLRTCS